MGAIILTIPSVMAMREGTFFEREIVICLFLKVNNAPQVAARH